MISRGELTAGTTANIVESGTTVVSISSLTLTESINNVLIEDPEFQALLIKAFSLLADGQVGNSPTHTSASSANTTSFHLPSPEGLHAHTSTTTTIQSGNQIYRCPWYLPGSDTQCDHVAPNKSALLRHLGKKHQVTGGAGAPIICHLVDSTTDSVCGASVKRGSFSRHLDTHYLVRFHCFHCPTGTSFSRQDTLNKHVKDKHTRSSLYPH